MPRVVSAQDRYRQLSAAHDDLDAARDRVARDHRRWLQATWGAGLETGSPTELHATLVESRQHYGHVEARVTHAERLWMTAKTRERGMASATDAATPCKHLSCEAGTRRCLHCDKYVPYGAPNLPCGATWTRVLGDLFKQNLRS